MGASDILISHCVISHDSVPLCTSLLQIFTSNNTAVGIWHQYTGCVPVNASVI